MPDKPRDYAESYHHEETHDESPVVGWRVLNEPDYPDFYADEQPSTPPKSQVSGRASQRTLLFRLRWPIIGLASVLLVAVFLVFASELSAIVFRRAGDQSEAEQEATALPIEQVFVVEGINTPEPTSLSTPDWNLDVSPLFSVSVQYWEESIGRWSLQYRIRPNMIATIIQIESCGSPSVVSETGAIGLFQVLPDMVDGSVDLTDPEGNARVALSYFETLYLLANSDLGLALAAYEAGPEILRISPADWPQEAQIYQFWGSGIYEEAERGFQQSPTLLDWMNAGGESLCEQAAESLGL